MRQIIARMGVVVTCAVGLIVLVTYLNLTPELTQLRVFLIDIALIVAGVAVLMGFFYLLAVHWQRFKQRRNVYSLILLLTAIVTLVVLVVDRVASIGLTAIVLSGMIVPAQAALGALLTVFLAMAAFRLARRRSWGAVWFLIAALVVLITQIPPTGQAGPLLSKLREIFDAIATGGMRGLLVGVALGTLAVAFRVLLAIDRPQSE